MKTLVTHVEPVSAGLDLHHLDCALAIAEAFESHVTALVFTADVMQDAPEVSDAEMQRMEAATARQIEEAAAARGVTCETRGRSSFAYGAPDVFSDHAKLSDLSVMGFATNPTMAQRMLAASAIFSTGRPALVVPPGAACAGLPRRVLVAWDGTPAAVRALHNALPLIQRAEESFVVSVTDDKEVRSGQSGIAVTQLLARHGAKASFLPLHKLGQSVMEALMQAAIDQQADLLVMGCVGHSPLHQLIFGSATNDLLHGRASIPVLATA